MKSYDIVIVGGGSAGLAAAVSAKENGIDSILILERDKELGGILNQCIHNGFGLHTFKEELTGPEYAARFMEQARVLDIAYKLNTMVLDIEYEPDIEYKPSMKCKPDIEYEPDMECKPDIEYEPDAGLPEDRHRKILTAMNRKEGLFEIQAKSIILAMGCRERPRGALNIPGFRPAGIFSAGTAQRLVNMEGYLPGRQVVILGSGDIGLIMARRMTLEGARVKVVAELMPYSGGLKRNIVQCLDDYDIPLKLNHTVVDIRGKERLSGITLTEVDEAARPIPGTEEDYDCDTLLLSVGLIPENELSVRMGVEINPVTLGPRVNESLETNLKGVFACGNVLHVHDLVDFVSEEAAAAGRNAAAFVEKSRDRLTASLEQDHDKKADEAKITMHPSDGVRYIVPETINPAHMNERLTIRFRVGNVYKDCYISVYFDKERVIHRKCTIVTPGEMEEIRLTKEQLLKHLNLKTITVKIEEA